ncbi:PLP-dependent cysteine synthase family protein [Micromonospora sp. DT31]|uniref:PLP-dependent cysteine synthase family protein n=1 Tax=Micromonospora sp. DT31 TaxID=3393434 RepID=UPI003CE7977B
MRGRLPHTTRPGRRAAVEATEAYQLPRLLRLEPNLYAACFTLMKMVPARHILRRALADGRLDPGTVIVETTSGTFGLALAMQGVHLDRRVVLVSDPVIDERLHRRLVDLGATVLRVPASAGERPGGYQAARLELLARVREEYPATFCPEQYTNPDNPRSYAMVAEHILDTLGPVDCLVGPVGSGGSMCGTAAGLRASVPHCQAIGVDTFASVLFGQEDGPRELRGLGMGLMPGNLDHRVFDHVHWCTPFVAYTATRRLHQRHALFMGPTSGAAYLVARWFARRNPHARVVVMLPDEGYRYQDTVYDDAWLSAHEQAGVAVPEDPVVVDDPRTAPQPWATFAWGRRPLNEVIAPAPAGAPGR